MIFLTIVALLFLQTLPLHTHSPHHDHHHEKLDQAGMLDEHEHHSEIHIASFDVNGDKDHGLATEIDLTAEAAVKNSNFNHTLVAILSFVVVLFVPFTISINRWSISLEFPFTTRGIAFRPPLRAPPTQ